MDYEMLKLIAIYILVVLVVSFLATIGNNIKESQQCDILEKNNHNTFIEEYLGLWYVCYVEQNGRGYPAEKIRVFDS